MEFIDAVGLPCPMPVVRAKKALEQAGTDGVKIKVDNFIAVQNLEKMAHGLGYAFEFKKISESEFDVVIGTQGDGSVVFPDCRDDYLSSAVVDGNEPNGRPMVAPTRNTEEPSPCVPVSLVVAIGSDVMGNGSDELGKVLMKSFIYSLTELESLPKSMLFFNSGAFLTASDSGALADLQSLADAGVRILTCGACVDYFKLSSPAVGEITNMFEIANIMSGATRLINL